MMPKFSETSLKHLSQCHPQLQKLFELVVVGYDCSVICGHRGEAEQERLFRIKASKLRFPLSKHNSLPSRAVDVVPWFPGEPHIRWGDTRSFDHFAGFVLGVAHGMGIKIRWGGDWNGNRDLHDQSFNDLVHFELLP